MGDGVLVGRKQADYVSETSEHEEVFVLLQATVSPVLIGHVRLFVSKSSVRTFVGARLDRLPFVNFVRLPVTCSTARTLSNLG